MRLANSSASPEPRGLIETAQTRNIMKTMTTSLVISFATLALCGAALAGSDKTLVSWVCLANTTQQGGSALTLQQGGQFDGIVFGEKVSGKWMAGSEGYARTQGDQQPNAVEKRDDKALIQMAVVYKGSQVAIYRNGEPYASYEANNIGLTTAKDNMAVFGLRHLGATFGQSLLGSIEDARIFDRALAVAEIKKLEPNQESEIKPYAWWTFEQGRETDLTGRFPINCLTGGARFEDGRLVLEYEGATLMAVTALPAADSANRANAAVDELQTYGQVRNRLIADRTRPTYHLISPNDRAHVADPNFAIFWKGRYHLFFISSGYAHVSSVDLIHWRWHPEFHGPLCSGGIFVNKDGRPTAITTSAWENGKMVLYTALDDDLDTWSAPVPIEPRVSPDQDASKMVCWDPEIWSEGNTTYALQGVHPLSLGKEATLFKSTDQKNWEYVGPFMTREMPEVMRNTEVARKNEDVSCPNFLKLGNKWMLLCISHIRGCRYYLGEWKNEKFTPDFHGRMNWSLSEGMKEGDHGGECFAPESLLTPDGRRVMWAWLFAISQKRISKTWHEVISLPRELSLPEDGVLRIKPLRELEQLRYNPTGEQNLAVENGTPYRLKGMAGDTIELLVAIKQGDARAYGVRVFCDKENGKGLDVVVEPGNK